MPLHPILETEEGTAHPVVYTFLYLPFGISAGYVIVTLAYLLAHAGVSVGAVAGLMALQVFPQSWKVLWAPIVDATLTARRWFVLATVATAATLVATALLPARPGSLWLLGMFIFASSVAGATSAMATEVLMTHATPHHLRGRVGGWSQAGNLGGAGLGGGVGLWMAQHVAPWSAGVVLGLICLACIAALWFVHEPARPHSALRFVANLATVGRDLWTIARRRSGYLTVLLFLVPICSGAASNLWSAVADDWRASADTVALVNGALGGLVSMAGCLIGGPLFDRMDRRTGYWVSGLLQAAVAVGMALAPRSPAAFVVFTCAYAFTNGFIYAAFTAVALETISKGSAATSYNLLASCSNVPITYLTLVEGWAHGRWGSGGMLYAEGALAVAAVVVFGLATLVTQPSLPEPARG